MPFCSEQDIEYLELFPNFERDFEDNKEEKGL